jgi:hypothetical protein
MDPIRLNPRFYQRPHLGAEAGGFRKLPSGEGGGPPYSLLRGPIRCEPCRVDPDGRC